MKDDVMSENNYITDKKLTGGMINSIGIAQQDLIAIKYIFDNMDNGLKSMCKYSNMGTTK